MREFKYRNVQPKAVVVEDEAVPYEGPYEVTSNGTLPTAGKTMGSDLTITVQPNLASLSVTENGDYSPTAPVQGFSSVTVNVPVGGNTLKTLLDATKSAYNLFSGYLGNDIADLIHYDDTSEVTNMQYVFNGCTYITSVPLLNTSKATNMSYMFGYCRALTTVPLFDTGNVTRMTQLFYNCQSLTSIPLFNTSKVETFQSAFNGCSALTEIPALDFSKAVGVNALGSTFNGCSSLTAIHATGMHANFNISSSTLFTREALVEIITNCATLTGTATLTMGATNLAKLTQADIDALTAKNWTLA